MVAGDTFGSFKVGRAQGLAEERSMCLRHWPKSGDKKREIVKPVQ